MALVRTSAIMAILAVILVGCGQAASPVPTSSAALPKSEPAAAAKQSDAMAKFDALVQAARKEGKLVISNSEASVRDPLKNSFGKKFGLEVEFLHLASNQLLSRLRIERQAGQYNVDAVVTGTSLVDTFIPNGWSQRLDEVLILPEVTDPSKWIAGQIPYVDPEHRVLRLNKFVSSYVSINSSIVGKSEIKSYKDLLDPKWKGKIVALDPTVPGAGTAAGEFLLYAFGDDYIKQLYAGQEPVFTQDTRQLLDWNAHGKYPIAVWGISPAEIVALQKDGLPVEVITLDKEAVGGGWGLVSMMDKAPNPNAAKLFMNWLASKEGQELFMQLSGRPVTRTDVDQSSIPDYMKLKPGKEYVDIYDYEFTMKTRPSLKDRIANLIKR